MQERSYPELRWMFAVPNSARRSPRQGAWMKSEGLKSGIWDVFLPAPRGCWHGLFVEMKAGKNVLSPEQKAFRAALEKHYRFAVCYNWIEAKTAILDYLEGTLF